MVAILFISIKLSSPLLFSSHLTPLLFISFHHDLISHHGYESSLTESFPDTHNLTLNNRHLPHRHPLQIRNIQRPTHARILPESGLAHGEQSSGGAEVENRSSTPTMQIVHPVRVRLVTGVFVDYLAGGAVGG